MKITTGKIILFIFILFTGLSSYAQSTDPNELPCLTPDGNPCSGPFTPPDDLPINENLVLLGLVAVSFGSYTIYKTNKPIKKASN